MEIHIQREKPREQSGKVAQVSSLGSSNRDSACCIGQAVCLDNSCVFVKEFRAYAVSVCPQALSLCTVLETQPSRWLTSE